MTVDYGWEEADEEQDQDPEGEWRQEQPILVESVQSQRVAPESTSWNHYNIPVIGSTLQPAQICTHKYHRYKAKFTGFIPANVNVYFDRVPDRLMSGALGATFRVNGGTGGLAYNIIPDYDGQQPLYAIADGAGAFIDVMDESYKAVQ